MGVIWFIGSRVKGSKTGPERGGRVSGPEYQTPSPEQNTISSLLHINSVEFALGFRV